MNAALQSFIQFCFLCCQFDPVILEIYNEIVDMVPEQWGTNSRKERSFDKNKKKLKKKQDCNKRNSNTEKRCFKKDQKMLETNNREVFTL